MDMKWCDFPETHTFSSLITNYLDIVCDSLEIRAPREMRSQCINVTLAHTPNKLQGIRYRDEVPQTR